MSYHQLKTHNLNLKAEASFNSKDVCSHYYNLATPGK